MGLTHPIIFATFFIIVRNAPTPNTQIPISLQMNTETPKYIRPTRSYGTQLDYIFDLDWNRDLFKYYNIPFVYDLTGPATSPPLDFNIDYSSHEHSPEAEHHEYYEEKPPFYVYNNNKQLFFEDIPHVKLLLENQQIRKYNNLPANYLGSLRIGHPFERYIQK